MKLKTPKDKSKALAGKTLKYMPVKAATDNKVDRDKKKKLAKKNLLVSTGAVVTTFLDGVDIVVIAYSTLLSWSSFNSNPKRVLNKSSKVF